MTRLPLFAALAALLLPATARAGDVALHELDVPLGARTTAGASAGMHFNMLALRAPGGAAVRYRVHRLHGRWTPWRVADDDVMWTGASDAFRVRAALRVRAVHVTELWSRVTAPPVRVLASAQTPAIVTRAEWGADEEIVRGKPVYAPSVRLAVVHHTVSGNTYTRAQAAAVVRGIEAYHVRGNGWNDIGYNFLVDRFGTVYEGRAGGVDRNVVGAHAGGFNTGTVGVSLLGSFGSATPSPAMQSALVSLLAWRLDVAHVDPLSTVVYTSGGNAKFPAGRTVTLRAISGHRDTGPTECPGSGAYRLLPAIARRVAATGLPKLYAPTVVGTLGGPMRFRARLSTSLAWSIVVADRTGTAVARGRGSSVLVDWTWRPVSAARGPYTWTIDAPGIRVATGTVGAPPPPPPAAASLGPLTVSPPVAVPGTTGTIDPVTVTFRLGAPAGVDVRVVAGSGATSYAQSGLRRPAGLAAVQLDVGHALADGRYQIVVTARSGGRTFTRIADLTVDRTAGGFGASARAFSPNGDGILDTTTFGFVLAHAVPVRLEILSGDLVVATPYTGTLPAGPAAIPWDGSGVAGPLYDGTSTAVLTVTDALGDVAQSIPVILDRVPPSLRLLDRQRLRFSLDEPAQVTVVVDGTASVTLDEPAGTFSVPWSGAITSLSAQAVDAAGNASVPLSG